MTDRLSGKSRQSGNIFFTLFGAVALVGIIGAGAMNVMKGPVRTMSMVTQKTIAENNMIASGKLAMVAAATQADGGDCDGDGYIEPVPYDTPSGAAPTGGGYLPPSLGAALNDPWDTRYAYCVWNHGSSTSGNGCTDPNMLAGENSNAGYVLAVISAGPDRVFQTSCNAYPTANALNKPSGSDDIVLGYTYAEAEAGSGGLWNLKSGDPNTAQIARDLEVTDSGGNVTFSLDSANGIGDFIGVTAGSIAGRNNEPLDVTGPFNLDTGVTCNATNDNSLQFDTSTNKLQYCDGAGNWVDIGNDNLGNHTATENVKLGSYYLSGDGGDEGILVASDGSVSTSGALSVGGTLGVTGATSLSTLGTSGLATLNSAAVTGNATVGGTLGVTGATSLSTLGTSGLATLNSLAVTNNASVGGQLDMTTGKIVNVLDPTSNQDAATKKYVDDQIAATPGAEVDPQVNTLTGGKWCVANVGGTAIDCTQDSPALSEVDPEVGTLTNGKWCTTDGSVVNCTTDNPDTLSGLSCNAGEIPKWNGSGWTCSTDSGGGATTTGIYAYGNNTALNTSGYLNFTTTVVNDFSTAFNGNTFTVPSGQGGWYVITSGMTISGGGNYDPLIYIMKNGAMIAASRDIGGNASTSVTSAAAVNKLAPGDTIKVLGSIQSGSLTPNNDAGTYFSLVKIDGGGGGGGDNLGDHTATQDLDMNSHGIGAIAVAKFNPVAGGSGVGITDIETDPQVGTLTNTKWCTSDGTVVNCTSDAPSGSDNLGNHTATTTLNMSNNAISAIAKATFQGVAGNAPVAGGGEVDPQVGTLTNGNWCITNGTTIDCTTTNGSTLTNLNASNLSSGTVGTARLGSGTANSSTYLRGDGTWAAPSGGGVTASTTQSCTGYVGCTTPACPGGYYRSGCSGNSDSSYVVGAVPSGGSQCYCQGPGGENVNCYVYCVK